MKRKSKREKRERQGGMVEPHLREMAAIGRGGHRSLLTALDWMLAHGWTTALVAFGLLLIVVGRTHALPLRHRILSDRRRRRVRDVRPRTERHEAG